MIILSGNLIYLRIEEELIPKIPNRHRKAPINFIQSAAARFSIRVLHSSSLLSKVVAGVMVKKLILGDSLEKRAVLLLRLEEALFLPPCRGFKGFLGWFGTLARGQVFLVPCTLRLVSLLLHYCLALVIVLIRTRLAIPIILDVIYDVPVSPLAVFLDLHSR